MITRERRWSQLVKITEPLFASAIRWRTLAMLTLVITFLLALNGANVQSIANTLATLHAVQWAGAATPAHGLAVPGEIITFTTADKKSNTLNIGADAGPYWNASAAGFDGTFLISKADHDALTADLLPAPAPAATPILPPASSPMPAPESSPAVSPK